MGEKKVGRPATGHDAVTSLRWPLDEREAVIAWGRRQDPPLGRSEAMRELLRRALAAGL